MLMSKRMSIRVIVSLCCASTIILIPSLSFTAENRSEAPKSLVTEMAPDIRFEETSHDFGVHGPGAELKYSFSFQNNGKADLIISKVKSSCGCTAAIASADIIPPRQSGKIDVTYKPGTMQGTFEKHVTVLSNDPDSPSMVLAIKASVELDLGADPDRLGTSIPKRGDVVELPFAVVGKELPRAGITKIFLETGSGHEALGKSITWTMKDDRTLDTPCYKVLVKVDSKNIMPGRYDVKLVIETSSRKIPRFDVPLFIEVAGPIKVDPRIVLITRIARDAPPVKTITLNAPDGPAFRILSAEINQPGLEPGPIPADSARSHALTILMKDAFNREVVATELVVKTDNPDMPEIRIPITARGRIQSKTDPDASQAPVNSLRSLSKTP